MDIGRVWITSKLKCSPIDMFLFRFIKQNFKLNGFNGICNETGEDTRILLWKTVIDKLRVKNPSIKKVTVRMTLIR